MPDAADRSAAIADTVHRYIRAVAQASADQLADFYADDASLEDPVGGEVRVGREAIHGFYSAITGMERECELVTLRVCGNEAAFHFRLAVGADDSKILIEPIETMVFDSRGKVTAMRAYWSPADVKQV